MLKKYFSKKGRMAFVLISILIISVSAVKTTRLFEISKNLEIFASVYKEVQLNYVEELNPGEMMKTGIDAMLASLDPYTNFYTEAQVEDALIRRKGDFGTPGIEVSIQKDKIVVSEVHSNTSAETEGVQLGDIILEINGRDFKEKKISEVYEAFEGADGSSLKLKVKRADEELEFNLLRKKPSSKNVPFYGMINSDYGYIKLDQFMDGSASEVRDAFEELRAGHNIKGLVLDLRNNGGGLLIDAIRILNLFVDKDQVLVTTRGRSEEFYKEYKTFNSPVDTKMPLVVLINNNSASASEIVSGSIQDLDRGIVIGQNSYGKGLVQNVLKLPYRHQMKVTISKYYIPSGRCIQEIDYSKNKQKKDSTLIPFYTKNKRVVYEGFGIKPDIEMEKPIQNEFMKELGLGAYIFNFATEFYNNNRDSVDFKDFKLPKNIYQDFKEYCLTNGFKYKSETEKEIENLKLKSEKEGFYSDMETTIGNLNSNIESSKSKDWERYKEHILPLIEIEIAKRYYGESIKFPVMFKHDKEIQKAMEVMSDKNIYNKTLQAL